MKTCFPDQYWPHDPPVPKHIITNNIYDTTYHDIKNFSPVHNLHVSENLLCSLCYLSIWTSLTSTVQYTTVSEDAQKPVAHYFKTELLQLPFGGMP